LRLHDHAETHTLFITELLWTSDNPDAETYLTTYNTRKRLQTSVIPAGFEPAVSEIERPEAQPWTARPLGSAVGRILQTASEHKRMTDTYCCIYIVVPPDDEQ
jgi:hypothetical protein